MFRTTAEFGGQAELLIRDSVSIVSLTGITNKELEELRRHENMGRPLGSPCFIREIEKLLGRFLGFRKPGPKVKVKAH